MQAGHRDEQESAGRVEADGVTAAAGEATPLAGPPFSPDSLGPEAPAMTQSQALAMVQARQAAFGREAKHPSRILCSELVEISWRGMDGCLERTVANMEEIWTTGATLDLDRALPEGAALSIYRQAVVLAGRVLYCQQNLTGYTIGVQFSGDCRWSPESFVPDHAVEVGALGRDSGLVKPGDDDAAGPAAKGLEAWDEKSHPRDASFLGLRSGSSALENLRPLIARGSLLALRGVMASK